MKPTHLFLITFLCIGTLVSRAQGTLDYLWTWNGNSGLFSGSFLVTAEEMSPNIIVDNGLYNLSFTSPDFSWSANPVIPSGDITQFTYYSSDSFGIDVYGAGGVTLVAGPSYMAEEVNNNTVWGELGSWSITYIPEPSSVGLFAVGAGAWLVKRKRLLSASEPK